MGKSIGIRLFVIAALFSAWALEAWGQAGAQSAPVRNCWTRRFKMCCQSTPFYQKSCWGTLCTMAVVHTDSFANQEAAFSGWSWDTVSPDCGPDWCEFYPVQCGTPQQPCIWLDSTMIVYCICHGYPGPTNCGPITP